MRTTVPFSNDAHEALKGCLLGVGLAAMAAFWWVWSTLHG
jgi:hypothetical protein